jgi:hypothetical protein
VNNQLLHCGAKAAIIMTGESARCRGPGPGPEL